ncbi:MAG: transposase [Anaerolineales bacterium]|nr:transposase [Anaerolineales bacterium]
MPTESTDSQVGSEQVTTLVAQESHRPKVVVADSLYCNVAFLSVFMVIQAVYALVRIRSNRVLYEEPPERQPGQRGRPRIQGDKFKLAAPGREADRIETCILLGQQVRLMAWQESCISTNCPSWSAWCSRSSFSKRTAPPLQASVIPVLDRADFGGAG